MAHSSRVASLGSAHGSHLRERARSRGGTGSAELVAILPALAVCLLIAAQVVAAGWALWSAGNAARAGARAERVGSDGEAVARRALPEILRRGAEVRTGDGVRVRVRSRACFQGSSCRRSPPPPLSMPAAERTSAQASIELLAGLPALLLAAALALQLLLVGYSLSIADGAAEAGPGRGRRSQRQ